MNDFLIDLQSGVHTFELSQTLTKKQFTAILNCCHIRGRLIHNEEKKESYVLLDKSVPGVTVTLYPIRSRKTYRMNIYGSLYFSKLRSNHGSGQGKETS